MRKYSRHRCTCTDVFTIGWIGSPVTECYLQQIAPALSEVCRRNRARVVLVGAQNAQFQNVPVKMHPWSEEGEERDIQSFDVGIMSLPDEPWERGKCGYKLIQYMACEKPVVASPVGINQGLVEHGVNGFLASNLQEWVEALSTLQHNKYLREDMGKAGRNLIEREYSLQVTAPRLLSILRSALTAGGVL